MRIAFVSDAIYPYNKGGKEKRIYELSTRLAKRGHDVHIYCMKWWRGENTRIEDGVTLHAISKLYPLYSGRRRSIRQAVSFGLSCLKLVHEDFDVIDVDHMPHLVLFPIRLVTTLKRKKLVATWNEVWGREYWVEYMGIWGNAACIVERLSVLAPDRIVSISEHTTNELRMTLSSKKEIVTIPMGINYGAIQKVRPSRNKSDIIFAGRLLSHKNVDVLIRSVGVLRQDFPDIACYIVGDGPERNRLIRLTQELTLENNITFLDFLGDHDALFALMKSSRVFVLPSTREGFGIVVLEANACGIPVITTNHKDNASQYLIDGKNGIVCRLNEDEIAGSIARFLKSNISSTDAAIVAKSHDWSSVTDQIETAYTNI
jgi:glycosyltransferase involved in cell wall biosynthesis